MILFSLHALGKLGKSVLDMFVEKVFKLVVLDATAVSKVEVPFFAYAFWITMDRFIRFDKFDPDPPRRVRKAFLITDREKVIIAFQ
jgi:hypothetical protein